MDNLRKEMKNRGINTNRLGLEVKINPSNLSQAIRGKIPFYPLWRKKISEYFQLPEDYLFKESERK